MEELRCSRLVGGARNALKPGVDCIPIRATSLGVLGVLLFGELSAEHLPSDFNHRFQFKNTYSMTSVKPHFM